MGVYRNPRLGDPPLTMTDWFRTISEGGEPYFEMVDVTPARVTAIPLTEEQLVNRRKCVSQRVTHTLVTGLRDVLERRPVNIRVWDRLLKREFVEPLARGRFDRKRRGKAPSVRVVTALGLKFLADFDAQSR